MNKCLDCKYLNESSSHCNSEVFCSKEIDELNADAYQQGREDKLKECKDALDKSVEMQTFWYKDGYQQGREDAIEEALAKIKEYASVWIVYSDEMTKEQIAQETLSSAKSSIVGIFERMKEQKNEQKLSNNDGIRY